MAAGFEAWRQLGGHGLQELATGMAGAAGTSAALPACLVPPDRPASAAPCVQASAPAAVCSALIALTLLPLARHRSPGHARWRSQLLAMVLLWLGPAACPAAASQSRWADRRWVHRRTCRQWPAAAQSAGSCCRCLASGLLLRLLDRDLRGRDWAWLGLGLALGLAPWPGLARLASAAAR